MSGPADDPGVRLVDELLARESALVRRDPGLVAGSAEGLEALLDSSYVEIGASGRWWDRNEVLAGLAATPRDARLLDYRVVLLAAGLALTTYRSVEPADEGGRICLRSSIWVLRDGRWRVRFHQGTPIHADLQPPDNDPISIGS